MKTIDDFLDSPEIRSLSPATVKALRSDLRNFVKWWEQARPRPFSVRQLFARDIGRWQSYRQQVDGVSPKTLNRNLFSLRRLCKWAVTQGFLPDNPAVAVKEIPEDNLAPRFLSNLAVDALARAPRQLSDPRLRLRDQALLALLIYAGLRSREACNVQLRDIDLDGASITVRQGKGRKARRVPIHSDAHALLVEYLEVRCPDGVPAIGSPEEREPLLLGLRLTVSGQPLEAGIKTRKPHSGLSRLAFLRSVPAILTTTPK